MKDKDWKQVIGGRPGLIMISAIIIFMVSVALNEVLDLPYLLLKAPLTPVNWAEIAIEIVTFLVIGLTAIVLIRQAESKRKKAKEALLESENRLKTLFECAPDAYFLHDMEGRFVDGNKTAQELIGYNREELIGKSFLKLKLLPAEQISRVTESLSQRMPGQPSESGELTLIRKDGSRVPVEISSIPVKIEGKTLVLGIARNITERKKAEESLRESEEKFRTISTIAKDAILMMDNEGNISYWNPAAEVIFGYSSQEVLGKGLHIALAPEKYHEAYRRGFSLFKRTGQGPAVGKTLEFDAVRKDGTEFPIELSLSAIKIKDRWHAVAIIRDITERKRVEQVLQKSQALLVEAQRIAHFGNWNWEIENNKLSWSDEIYRIFGVEPEEFGADFDAFFNAVYPEDKELVKKSVDEALTRGKPINFDHRIILPDGAERIVHEQGEVFYDETRKPIRLAGTVQDITDRKKAEDALRESERKYRSLSKNIPGMVYRAKADWSTEIISGTEGICGYPVGEFSSGKANWLNIVHSDNREKILEESHKLKEKPAELVQEYRIIDKKGNIRWVEDHKRSLFSEQGVFQGIDGVVFDITKRKNLLRQLIQSEKLAVVGTLAYGIAHEFNNILAGMMANAEFGLITADPQQIKECFETIAENSKRASSITNNLLVFAREKEGKKELADITQPLESVLAITRRELGKANVEIVEKLEPIPKIFCDPGQFSEVFLNIVTNARDAMHPEGGILTIKTEPRNDNIRIIFEDTGCGIPKELKGRIFESVHGTDVVVLFIGPACLKDVLEGCHSIDVLPLGRGQR